MIRRSMLMSFAFLLAVAPAVAAAQTTAASPAPATSPAAAATPAPTEEPAVTAALKKQFLAVQAGKIDRSDYDAKMNSLLTDASLAQVSAQLKDFGPPTKLTFVDRVIKDDNRVYIYSIETAKAKLQGLYAVDAAGKISGLFFRPAP